MLIVLIGSLSGFRKKNDLKFQQWENIKFYEKGEKNTQTETMEILVSPEYEIFWKLL